MSEEVIDELLLSRLRKYEKHNLSKEEFAELLEKLYQERAYLYEKEYKSFEAVVDELLLSRLRKYEKHNLSEEELTELFLKSYKEGTYSYEKRDKLYDEAKEASDEQPLSRLRKYERYNLSEEELPKFKQTYNTKKVEGIVVMAVHKGLLPVIKYFIENGGNPYFVIEEFCEEFTIFNLAAKRGRLDIINYLLDNNIFTVDQRASENSVTPFHSAVEWDNISAAKLLLQKGADINAKFKHGEKVKTAWFYVFELSYIRDRIEMEGFLLKHGIYIPEFSGENMREFSVLLGVIRGFEKSYFNPTVQYIDFTNSCESLPSSIKEIWDVRISRNPLNKFSKESAIGYEEYVALRGYNSLPKDKKEVLKTLLARKNFNSDDLIKVDNYIKAHFFEIACIAKDLKGTVFEAIAETGIIGEITQYLHFEDSSIKIAGSSSDSSADNITN